MGLRYRNSSGRARRCDADHHRPGRSRHGSRLHRSHVCGGRPRRPGQHDRNGGRRPRARHLRIDRAHPSGSGRLVGAGRLVHAPADRARRAPARIVWQMKFWIGMGITLAITLAVVGFVNFDYLFFAGYTILMFVMLATAWNILGGYAGYVNFGTPAFFGLGAYTAAVLYKATAAPLGVQILAAAVMAGALGFGTGMLTLRLRGIFFAIATIAITVIMETLFINWRYAGGATGLQLLRPPLIAPFESYIKMLFVVMGISAVVSVAIARYIERSWIGRGLRAIRDSEEAAEASGVPTLRLKLFACTVSGALMGV